MKIALFPPSLEGGGVERVTLNLARGFAAAGVQTDLILIKPGGRLSDQIPADVNVVYLNASRAMTSIPPLIRYLQREKPDVLLAASEAVNLPSIWARMLGRGIKTRIGVIVMNTLSVRQANTTYRREKLYPLLARWFYPRADYVITLADGIRHDLAAMIHMSADRILTIPSPVLTPDFYERLEKPAEHPWFQDVTGGESKDEDKGPVILGVARFVPAKDLPNLIRAFALVRQDRPARLLILGDGVQRPMLESLVAELGLEDSVSMPGFMDNLPFMKAADVFVLSSIFEGLPTVLIEALGASRAIVSTDCPSGPQEILDGGKYGEIVPMRDPDALAAAILRVLDNPPDAAHLRQRAEHYRMERIIDRYLALFA